MGTLDGRLINFTAAGEAIKKTRPQSSRDMIRLLLLLANVTCVALARTIIVVGSGPGGSGFLERRLAEHEDTVLWFESGELRNDMATDWPVRLTRVDKFWLGTCILIVNFTHFKF